MRASSMRRDTQRRLDIGEATAKVARYVQDLGEDEFLAGGLGQDAILRQLTVAGEAAFKVSRDWKARHPEIPWAKIAGFRHRVVHDYFGIDLDAVWRIATVELPLLGAQASAILAAEFPESAHGPPE